MNDLASPSPSERKERRLAACLSVAVIVLAHSHPAAEETRPPTPVEKAASTASSSAFKSVDSTLPGTQAATAVTDPIKAPNPFREAAAPSVPVPPPPAPAPELDSVKAVQYRIVNRPFNRDEAKSIMSALPFKPEEKPESTSVNIVYRDKRGPLFTFEPANSEYAFIFEKAPFLNSADRVPDSLIRYKTDPLLKSVLKEKSSGFTFVNFEKTMVQVRDPGSKDGKPMASVPAYYLGRYLRKQDNRIILGDNFQIRIGYGQGGTLSYLSYRNPLLQEASTVMVPSKAKVLEYLENWSKIRSRRGIFVYPYHPDKLRVRSLKPVRIFESYVTEQEKEKGKESKAGAYLVPKVTVLAEATFYPMNSRLQLPLPENPVLLHFQFPCTPETDLCWPSDPVGIATPFKIP